MVMPAFKRVSDLIKGCTFAIMDVNQDNKKVVTISEASNHKLKFVPFIVFYKDGLPTAYFTPNENAPDQNFEALKRFVVENTKSKKQIAPNSIGFPSANKKDVCYLTLNDAYS
jgi:hypothetical protein